MKNKKETLIIDGNAFYEIDLDCINKRKQSGQACSVPDSDNSHLSKTQKRQRN